MKEASRSKAIEVAAIPASALDRRGKPHGPFRRLLRAFIHFFSYHVILSRRSVRTIPAAGFRLSVPPTVFHPRFFLSSEYFAEFIDRLDLSGKSVVDIGKPGRESWLSRRRAPVPQTSWRSTSIPMQRVQPERMRKPTALGTV
jgi:hypothetical protein